MRVEPWQAPSPPHDLPPDFTVVTPPFARAPNSAYVIPSSAIDSETGDAEGQQSSRLMVYENGIPLGPAHGMSDEHGFGYGLFSHWKKDGVYFIASDNTDPNTNGRQYAVTRRDAGVVLPPGTKITYPWPMRAGQYTISVRARSLHPGVAARLAVKLGAQIATELTFSAPEWQSATFAASISKDEGVLLQITNVAPQVVWVDYVERSDSK
jgi:hypothetical protein